MNIWEIFCLGIALAVDVFCVSLACGLLIKRYRLYIMFRLAVVCGVMQGFMPVLGYWGTEIISSFIDKYAGYLIFLVFFALGVNTIKGALEEKENSCRLLTWYSTFAIGFSTSIDALVSGSTILLTNTSLLLSSVVIGSCSFLAGILGFNLYNLTAKISDKYLQISAGLILIGLGLKNLFF